MTGLNASACPKRNACMNVNSFKFCGPLCCGLLSTMYLCILQQLQSRSVCLWRWQGDCRCDVPMCFSCWPLSWRQIILYELWTMQNWRRPSGLGQIQSQPFWAELGAGALRFRHLLRVGDLLRYRSDHEALCNMSFQYQSIFGFYSIEIIQPSFLLSIKNMRVQNPKGMFQRWEANVLPENCETAKHTELESVLHGCHEVQQDGVWASAWRSLCKFLIVHQFCRHFHSWNAHSLLICR